jgi:hypothetical protein
MIIRETGNAKPVAAKINKGKGGSQGGGRAAL